MHEDLPVNCVRGAPLTKVRLPSSWPRTQVPPKARIKASLVVPIGSMVLIAIPVGTGVQGKAVKSCSLYETF